MTEAHFFYPSKTLRGWLGKSPGSCPKQALLLPFTAHFRKPKPREIRACMCAVTHLVGQSRGLWLASLHPKVEALGFSSVSFSPFQSTAASPMSSGRHQLTSGAHPPCPTHIHEGRAVCSRGPPSPGPRGAKEKPVHMQVEEALGTTEMDVLR